MMGILLPILEIHFNLLYGLCHLLGLFVLDEGVFKLLIILDTEFLYPSKIIGPEEVDAYKSKIVRNEV